MLKGFFCLHSNNVRKFKTLQQTHIINNIYIVLFGNTLLGIHLWQLKSVGVLQWGCVISQEAVVRVVSFCFLC